MKFRFLIILVMFSLPAYSNDEDNESTGNGDTIWIEEKVSPTTTWLENLVKPLTVWMEQQLNSPAPNDANQKISPEIDPNNERDTNTTVLAKPDNAPDENQLIGSERAGQLAQEHIAGEVLFIKFIAATSRYRVKLISERGEIHIIYIQATSGDVIPSQNNNNKEKP